MSGQVTGIVQIFVDGTMLRSKPGAKLKLGGMKRDAVVGHSVYGYTEEPVPSELDATIAHMADTNVREMSDWDNVTLRFVTDSGDEYDVSGAWTSEPCELTGGGDVSLKMMGQPAVRV